jgi:hypothetical protein
MFRKAGTEAGEASDGADHTRAAAEEEDASMTGSTEMGPGETAAGKIVGEELRRASFGHILVGDDNANRAIDECRQAPVVQMVGQEDKPVDMVALEHLEIAYLATRPVQRCEERDAKTSSVRLGLYGCDQLCEEGVCDVRDDQPYHFGSTQAQPARVRIGLVIERADRLLDAVPGLFRQVKRSVQKARHSGHGNAGSLRHSLQPRWSCRGCCHRIPPLDRSLLRSGGFVNRFSPLFRDESMQAYG